MKKCFSVHTPSVLHGGVVGAGSLWPYSKPLGSHFTRSLEKPDLELKPYCPSTRF